MDDASSEDANEPVERPKGDVKMNNAAGISGASTHVPQGGPVAVDPAALDLLVDCSRAVEVERIDLSALPAKPVYRAFKRVCDVVISAFALVVAAIPMAVIAMAVKLDSRGPVLYRQERLGLNGKPFMLVKFRSMRLDAENPENAGGGVLVGPLRMTRESRRLAVS